MGSSESQLLSDVYAEVEQRFEGINDPAHGWEHIQRVYKLALYIAEQEHADTFIVGMAALLHDLGHLSNDSTKHHAELSVSSAAGLLSAYPIAPGTQQAILHAIAAHSFSLGIVPGTPEATFTLLRCPQFNLRVCSSHLGKETCTCSTPAYSSWATCPFTIS